MDSWKERARGGLITANVKPNQTLLLYCVSTNASWMCMCNVCGRFNAVRYGWYVNFCNGHLLFSDKDSHGISIFHIHIFVCFQTFQMNTMHMAEWNNDASPKILTPQWQRHKQKNAVADRPELDYHIHAFHYHINKQTILSLSLFLYLALCILWIAWATSKIHIESIREFNEQTNYLIFYCLTQN